MEATIEAMGAAMVSSHNIASMVALFQGSANSVSVLSSGHPLAHV